MLFTKEITKITFEDVINFCNEQIQESINLDYKREFPTDLEKTISSFANTMGGLIIIGVEDDDGNPKLPARGLKYERGLSERVISIILSNIYPPVFPEIQVCDPVKNRTFVIIRVPQSNMTPHYIRHRTKIYIRTGDITQLERLAPAEQIEWLWDRRKKSEELREILYATALERYNNHIKLRKLSGILFSEATISTIPLYPTEPYKSPQEIKQIGETIKASGYHEEFPYLQYEGIRPVQGGIASFAFNKETQYINYTELNQFGLFYHKEDLGILEKVETKKEGIEKTEKIKRAYLFQIIRLIDLFLEASADFYEKLGYWGLVGFKFSLEKLLGIELMDIGEMRFRYPWWQNNISVDERLKWRRKYYVSEIKNKRAELLVELLRDIGWSLGWEHITEDRIKEVLKKYGRLPEIEVSSQTSNP